MRSSGHTGVTSYRPAASPLWRWRCRTAAAAATAATLAITWLGGSAVNAATITAGALARVPCSPQSLDQAIANAPANAKLVLTARCTYRLSAALPTIERNLIIDGNGATITRRSGAFTMITVEKANLALSRITISGAESASGPGGVLASGGASVAVTGSRFVDNHGAEAGAMEAARYSLLTVTRSSFTGNQGTEAGAVEVYAGSRLTADATTFAGNHASTGGAIGDYNFSNLSVTGSSFSRNAATAGGGAIALSIASVGAIQDSSYSGNTSDGFGGAIECDGRATLTVRRASFAGNAAARYGGAIWSLRSLLSVTSTRFSRNSAESGGAVANYSGTATTFANSTFTANRATGNGGAITTDTAVNLVRDSLSGNRAGSTGGALAVTGQHTSLNATRIIGNSAGTSGGGISDAQAVSMTRSVVRGNQPDNCAAASCTNSALTRITVRCSAASLGAAIASAPDNAILVLRPGCVYRLSSALPNVTRDLTIDGNGDTITRQSGSFTVLTDVGVNLALKRIRITNANDGQLHAAGVLSAVQGAHVTVTNCGFVNDHGSVSGVVYADSGTSLTMNRDRFSGNEGYHGGAIGVSGDGAAAVRRSSFVGNSATSGGAIESLGGPVTVADSRFYGNRANVGGAISSPEAFLGVSGTVFRANAGGIYAGAIYDNGTATVFASSRFTANTATTAGGIGTQAYLALVGDVLSGNRAAETAGAVAAKPGRVDLIASRVVGNVATTAPGGILSELINLSNGSIVAGNHPGNCSPATC